MGRHRKAGARSLDGLNRVVWHQNKWYYRATPAEVKAGSKTWIPLSIDDAEARLKYAEIKNALGQFGGMDILFDKFLVDVVARKKAERTRKDDRDMISKLKKVFGQMEPTVVLPRHIQQYVDLRSQSSVTQSRKEYSVLNQLFNRAKVWIDLKVNPCEGVLLPEKPKARSRLPEIWEIREVRKYAEHQLKLYIDFKFATGLDQGVILKLKVDDVLKEEFANYVLAGHIYEISNMHLIDNGIRVARSKTGVQGIVSWTPDLKLTVLNIFRLRSSEARKGTTLFCSRLHNPWNKSTFNNKWQLAKKKAKEQGSLKANFTEHDIRAAHLKAAEELGFDGTTQLLHSDQRTTKIYRRSKEIKVINPVKLG